MVSLFIFPTGSIALDSKPRGRNTSKIWDTTGTVFIQGTSILLLVWRSIMFNGSFLRVCRILRFVKKTRCLGRVPKHRNQWPLNKDGSCCISYFWCIFHRARNRELSDLLERWIRKPQPRNESSKYSATKSFWGQITSPLLLSNGSYALALGRETKPGHHGLVRLDSRRQNQIFSQSIISYTLLRMNHLT